MGWKGEMMNAEELPETHTVVVELEGFRVAEPQGIGYVFDPVSQEVLGAAITVHKRLGPGFREEPYLNALCVELETRGLVFRRKADFPVYYEGRLVGAHELDLLVENTVIVELKAVSTLLEVHQAQLMAYLRATNL